MDTKIIDSIRQSAKTTPQTSYSLPISTEECHKYLVVSFSAEVGREVDEITNSRLLLIARWLVGDMANRKPSLLLFGGKGLGKTCSVKAMVRMIDVLRTAKVEEGARDYWKASPEQRNLYEWWKVLPVPTIASTAKIVEMYEKYQEGYKKLMTSTILAIDDLGVEPVRVMVYGTDRTPLIDIINYRYDKKMPTIITTNLDTAGISQLYGDRTEDRIKEMCNRIAFEGESYRR